MKPPPLQSFRASVLDWLFCWESLRAAIQLLLAIALLVIAQRLHSQVARDATALLLLFVIYRPVVYFLLPPLLAVSLVVLLKFDSMRAKAEYPCPVCGYDVRETLSRCPECGTELQWGQLPDESGEGQS